MINDHETFIIMLVMFSVIMLIIVGSLSCAFCY